MKEKEYYIGLDIGTDSVGYAATDTEYNLLKFHGEPAWGVTLFDAASLKTERRAFRTGRRRLDRRQHRVNLIQELFAPEIIKVDKRFFIRLQESRLFRKDVGEQFTLFNDPDFTDKEYYDQYPTIHHLICELMESDEPHDVRMVYLACAWLVAHRGHFLSNISEDNVAELQDFHAVYDMFLQYFIDNEYEIPWSAADVNEIGEIIKKKVGVEAKKKALAVAMFKGVKPPKEAISGFPFSAEAVIKLLSGGTCKLKDLFQKEEYEDFGSVSLGMDDDKLGEIMANIGEDYDLIAAARRIYDWGILTEVLGSHASISAAKVDIYKQHKADLESLKRIVRKYIPDRYDEIFRHDGKSETPNYASYAYHSDGDGEKKLKKTNKEDFSKFITNEIHNIAPDECDKPILEDMLRRLELKTFMPKQKDTDNRVIPYQLYQHELRTLLKHAQKYLPFLQDKDESGMTVSDKIMSVFSFRIPYFVGPLNPHSEYSWLVRKEGKIYPWNFSDMVDLDQSEQEFIKKLMNFCTYLPGETVLPKDSLCYHRFMVLNEINNLCINNQRISVDLKQSIYTDLFCKRKKVRRKDIVDYLICNGYLVKGEEDKLSGIDITVKSDLVPQISFKRLLNAGILTFDDVERIIERSSYAEDKSRLSRWLEREYPNLSEDDRKYICRLKIKDFGRMSRKFLCDFEGVDKETGEATTILDSMWNTNNNLMELLSDRFTFIDNINAAREDYYREHPKTLDARLDDMYISNSVKRPIHRSFAIIKDLEKAFGKPRKIFIEMARGGNAEQKGKRTTSRKQQILDLYTQCRDEDVRLLKQQLDEMGIYADNRLQSDKLFLYYNQLGRCMYSGEAIDLNRLATKEYDIEHIYPQSVVKDDSILNNKVLVLSKLNGEKGDTYPISPDIQKKMMAFWKYLCEVKLIGEEKYKRLTRTVPFSPDEKWGFINRQLTETSQAMKAVADLLKEKYPDAEIVYSKARLVSEFRQEFDCLKSRTYNDLHHAKDAYLNIVVGNVYHMKFSKQWFDPNSRYSVKTKVLFTNPVYCRGELVWDGNASLDRVKRTVHRNNAHLTKYAFFRMGGLFKQNPLGASEGLVPLKKGLPTEQYGGYNKASIMFFIPVKYRIKKKNEITIMSVELMHGKRFLTDKIFAEDYTHERLKKILGKEVKDISFPMGMRPWKVNTMLSLDGFRVCITGSSKKGKAIIIQPVMQFSANGDWDFYIKKLEMLVQKIKERSSYVYSEEYDKISAKKNVELYKLYVDKLKKSVYRFRYNVPISIIDQGMDAFEALPSEIDQAKVLMNIHQLFCRCSRGCDLSAIGGTTRSASMEGFGTNVSNWSKNYKRVTVIDSSPSGLWTKESCNILELL